MEQKKLELLSAKFKIEELEPRLEMGKWSAKAGCTENWPKGSVTTYQEVSFSSD